MKATKWGAVRFPALYDNFKNAKEIADAINRSPSYVKKALRDGFTKREEEMLEKYTGKELFT